jgi:hypothetical protein
MIWRYTIAGQALPRAGGPGDGKRSACPTNVPVVAFADEPQAVISARLESRFPL